MTLIVVIGSVLLLSVPPRTHRIFYDEDIYQSIGLNIAYLNKAVMSNDGAWRQGEFVSYRQEYNKQPNAWPFLISLAFRLCGVNEDVAFTLTNFLFPISVLLIFICGSLLFKNALIGIFSAIIYTLIPENLLWFSTMAVEPATACFTLLAITAVLLYINTRNNLLLLLVVSSLAFAIQFRIEVCLIIFLVFIVLIENSYEDFKTMRLYWFALLFIILIIPYIEQIYMFRNNNWGSTEARFSLKYFWQNLSTNTFYYFNGKRFPILFTVLALMGIANFRNWRITHKIILWFLLTWGIFLFFYAGSYEYGADVRYSIPSMVPLALMGGAGMFNIYRIATKYIKAKVFFVIIILLFVTTTMYYLPFIRAVSQESWESRDDHDAAKAFAHLIPEDGVVLTHNPGLFHVLGKSAAQMSLYTERPDYVRNSLIPRYRDKIFLHWNFWCNVPDPTQNKFARNIMENYETELIAEKLIRARKYAIYKIGKRKM